MYELVQLISHEKTIFFDKKDYKSTEFICSGSIQYIWVPFAAKAAFLVYMGSVITGVYSENYLWNHQHEKGNT